MKTVTLGMTEQETVEVVAARMPGVSRHRIARCLLRLGLGVDDLDAALAGELVRLDAEERARRVRR